jgi:drug/metabolite transporter (DMT)-like permease
MRIADLTRLVALAAIWGASFIFLRALAPVLGPVPTATARVVIAGLALVAYFRISGFDGELARHWRHYFVIGVVNSAVPFSLYAFVAVHLPASYSVILNTATPLFAAVLSSWWLDERLTAVRVAGLIAGAAGVTLVTSAGPVVPDAMFGWAVAACLCAALCYALAGIYVKRHANTVKPMAIAGWSQVFAGAVLLPFAAFAHVPGTLGAGDVANVLALALLCSAIAYLLYYRLIADLGPTRAMTVTYLMPLFGMVWSVLFLAETITLAMLAGCALIVGGTLLVARHPGRPVAAAPAAVPPPRRRAIPGTGPRA